jgi:hypothetical protein
MAEKMQYPEFRQKLIDLVRQVVKQLPELRPNVELLAKNLADKEKNGDLTSLLYGFSNRVSVQDLQNQLRDLGNAANHATTYGCTQKQFESWKYNRDLKLAIEQAIGEKIWG